MPGWPQSFVEIITSSLTLQSLLFGLLTIQCLISVFLYVLVYRFALWLWDWLDFAEARNLLDSHPGPNQLPLIKLAEKQRRKWLLILIVSCLLAVGIFITLVLFLNSQPNPAIILSTIVAACLIGIFLYAVS